MKYKLLCTFLFLTACLISFAQLRTVQSGTDIDHWINKCSFYTPANGFIAYSHGILGYTADSGKTIAKKAISNVTFQGYPIAVAGILLNGVKAFNYNNLLVYGSYWLSPIILLSTDGGNSFIVVYYSAGASTADNGVVDMTFPANNTIGYAADDTRVLKTTDAGHSWQVIASFPNIYFTNIEAADNNCIIVFSGGNHTYYTTRRAVWSRDGGASWQELIFPQSTADQTLWYTYFRTAAEGWLNIGVKMYKTTDGAASWKLLNDSIATPINSRKFHFFDSNRGYLLDGYRDVYKTTSEGILWEPLPSDHGSNFNIYALYDLCFLNEQFFWVGGWDGYLEMTSNSGGAPLPKAYFKEDTTGLITTKKVNLYNFSNPSYTCKWYVNNVFAGSSYNSSYERNFSFDVDEIKLIVSDGMHSDTLIKSLQFYVPNLPVIRYISPKTGTDGTVVRIYGNKFYPQNVTGVKFGNNSALSYAIESDTVISAVIAPQSSGPVAIQKNYYAVTGENFIYSPPPTAAPPQITGIYPDSGSIGSLLTIDGNNFAGNSADNLVLIGDIKAEIVSSTTNKLICKIPAGLNNSTVSVLNRLSNLWGTTTKSVNIVYANSAKNFTGHSFTPKYRLLNQTDQLSPVRPFCYDINLDGKPDIVSVISHTNGNDSISMFLNNSSNGNFSFLPRINIARTFAWNNNIAIADVDGDGLPDISQVVDNGSNIVINVKVYRNVSKQNTAFDTAQTFVVPIGAKDVKVRDIDNDGRPDLVIPLDNGTCILKNTSTKGFISFGSPTLLGGGGMLIATADLDDDGKPDLVVYGLQKKLVIRKNTSTWGNISFSNLPDIPVPGSAYGYYFLDIKDMNQDNKPDVIIANDSTYAIYENKSTIGSIAFSEPVSFLTLPPKTAFGISNLSGGNKPDILFAQRDSFSIVKSTPGNNLIFSKPVSHLQEFPNIIWLTSVNGCDFNLDGKNDLLFSDNHQFGRGMMIYGPSANSNRNIEVCAGNYVTVESDVPGQNFRWQQDTGFGFFHISDNSSFSGTHSRTLTIKSVSKNWINCTFRAIADEDFQSSDFKIAFTNRWLGNSSSDWNNPTNWSCGTVPDANTSVVILFGTIQVTANAVCKSLSLSTNAILNVNPGVKLTIIH